MSKLDHFAVEVWKVKRNGRVYTILVVDVHVETAHGASITVKTVDSLDLLHVLTTGISSL